MERLKNVVIRHRFWSRVAGLVAAASVVALIGLLVAAVARPISDAAAAGDPKAALKQAITADYEIGQLPPGYVAGHLTPEQKQQLMDKIAKEMSKHFTGAFLTGRLSDLQQWAESISDRETVRVIDVKIKDFNVATLEVTGDTALATGSYTVYLKNEAKGDDNGHTVTWGGTTKFTFVAQLQQVGSQWLVSSYYSRQTEYQEDNTAKSGWEYLPSEPPAATAP